MIDRKNIKIVFMGTPEFAKCSLEKLYESGYNILKVFTNPDKPSGRGMKLKASEVKEYALSKNIEVEQPLKLRNNEEVISMLKELAPDFIVVVAYGKILPEEILNIPKYGCVNVHGSLLPQYRGAAPIQWSIINGDKKTGITTMYMDKGMDTGDMLLKEEVDILDDDDLESMFSKLALVGAELLIKTLDKIVDGSITRTKQSEEGTLAPQITREMTKLDFNKTSLELVNFIRGIGKSMGTYMLDENDNKYKVYSAKIYEENLDGKPGEVVLCDKKRLVIKCNDSYLQILEIQAPNSKKIDISAFLAGNKFEIGKRFV